MATGELLTAHVRCEAFKKNDEELAELVLAAVKKVCGNRELVQIDGEISDFGEKLFNLGGISSFRVKYASGHLTDLHQSLLICCSRTTDASNIIEKQFDALGQELLIKYNYDPTRHPKVTWLLANRWVGLFQDAVLPALAEMKKNVRVQISTAKRLKAMVKLPSDMFLENCENELNVCEKKLAVFDAKSQDLRVRLARLSTSSTEAWAISQRFDNLSTLQTSGHCSSSRAGHHSNHHSLAVQLLMSVGNVARAQMNRERATLAEKFKVDGKAFMSEAIKLLNDMASVVETVRGSESTLESLVATPQQSVSASLNTVIETDPLLNEQLDSLGELLTVLENRMDSIRL